MLIAEQGGAPALAQRRWPRMAAASGQHGAGLLRRLGHLARAAGGSACSTSYSSGAAPLLRIAQRTGSQQLPCRPALMTSAVRSLASSTAVGPTLGPRQHAEAAMPRGALGSFACRGTLLQQPAGSSLLQSAQRAAAGVRAIGIKTWRRLKMKKHRIRKRRKANRHKSK